MVNKIKGFERGEMKKAVISDSLSRLAPLSIELSNCYNQNILFHLGIMKVYKLDQSTLIFYYLLTPSLSIIFIKLTQIIEFHAITPSLEIHIYIKRTLISLNKIS